MTDIWSFLLQTLTVSGAAVLLLTVKVMFRDKLSPRWQFCLWSVLALVLLAPAGWGGRHILFNWPQWVEILKTLATGEYGTLTEVLAPIPLPLTIPRTWADWLFLVYAAGVVVLLVRYVVSYVRLRLVLRQGEPIRSQQVKAVAERYGLPTCPVVAVDGLPTAFICGVFRPVLALPAGREPDGKVILHELLHLRHKDVVWGWIIAFFRCVHWCNPILWLCADWAGNDLESLCDQRVLERLEGEERRDYGRILLSMADERYARAPGTSSASNGGENVRRRIEAIARFKRYPAGMALASVCVTVVLAVPLVVGVRAESVPEWRGTSAFTMSAARAVRCSTPAGAIDAYAKGILTGELPYMAMSAPLDRQNELAAAYGHGGRRGIDWMIEQAGLPCRPSSWEGYRVFNLEKLPDGSCEGLLVIPLSRPPEGRTEEDGAVWIAAQPIRAERQGDRWVVVPQGNFQPYQDYGGWAFVTFPREAPIPAKVYEARHGDFIIRAEYRTTTTLCLESGSSTDLVPIPHGIYGQTFGQTSEVHSLYAVYTGDPADKGTYKKIAVSSRPWDGDRARPQLRDPRSGTYSSGSSSSGSSWSSTRLTGDWADEISLDGGGTTFGWERDGDQIPDRIAADLYLNDELAAELTLLPVEGGGVHD